MKRDVITQALLVLSLVPTIVLGAFPLHQFYSRAVKDGYSTNTAVDSVKVNTVVNSGVAISRYSLVLTPGTGNNSDIEDSKRLYDSIEITASFQLPTDFVADSMWLWIEGKPVPAFIQDRAMASQQYQQIVGTRKDPAILETWGNGSYSLRIFPAASLKSRKIELQFHHVFDDNALFGKKGEIAASLPLFFDSTYANNYSGTKGFNKKLSYLEATFSSSDFKKYTVAWPGLGEGSFSTSKTLVLSGSGITKLDTGFITSEDLSGADEYLWTGSDANSELFTAGITTDFSTTDMRFEPEPDTRIIMIDMHAAEWDWNTYYTKQAEGYGNTTKYTTYQKYNIWERAQKYAILALQQYLSEGQKFNVIIGGKETTALFPAPVAVSEENITIAIKALLAATPSSESSTAAVLKAAIAQAPKGIGIIISDLFQPAVYQIRTTTLLNGKTSYTYVTSKEAEQYAALIADLTSIMKTSSLTLFTVNDVWQISQLALQSGGFQLASLLNRYNIQYKYEVVDGIRISLPQLPPLFGSNNGSGLRNLSVSSDILTDCVYSIDGNYGRYYYGGGISIETDAVRMAKTRIAVDRGYYSSGYINPGRMLIAGKTTVANTGKPAKLTISGKLDGLWFSRTLTASGSYLPISTSSYAPITTPQWAYRASEQLAFNDQAGNALLIKKIGKEYHIVTRQTSLLALEPGMNLWEDTLWEQQQANVSSKDAVGGTAGAREAGLSIQADMAWSGGAPTVATGSGVDFDGFSVENLIKKNKMSVTTVPAAVRHFAATASGSLVRITLPSTWQTQDVSLQIIDLNGRLVAQKRFTGRDVTSGMLTWNLADGRNRSAKGIYSVKVSAGSIQKVFRITLIGK